VVVGRRLRFFFVLFFGAVVALLLDEDGRRARGIGYTLCNRSHLLASSLIVRE
jgi:hypothetical protein